MKPDLDPTFLAEQLLGSVLVAFEHREDCGLHSLTLQSEGKVSRPNRLRIRCGTCGGVATLPTPAHFLRAWNRKADLQPEKALEVEVVVEPATKPETHE